MRLTAGRSVSALLLSLCALIVSALLTAPGISASHRTTGRSQPQPTADNPARCQNDRVPPPPVDTSEDVAPGAESPTPLPVPDEPVGGTRMGECGVLQPTGAAAPPQISAQSWLIADLDSGQVLAARDPHGRQRPASLIKTLLSIVVIRELPPDMVVTGTQEDADQEGTKVGIGPGGTYTVHQLLMATVMQSGNDTAFALARALGGVPTALDKMNALARELGALDTRAATPSGLDGPGMTTSAYDQALIFRAAMRHKEFVEAASTRQLDFPGYRDKRGFLISNDNRLLDTYPGFLAGKTGFTDDARHTYAAAARQDGRSLVVVLLRGERKEFGPLADQGALLLDYGFGLIRQANRPVGSLVERSPEAQPKQDTGEAAGAVVGPAASITDRASARTAFGTVGAPLVILAGLVVLLAGALYLRRRLARTR